MSQSAGKKRKRLWWLIAIAVLLLIGVPFYIEYFLARPAGSGPAGPAVAKSSFQKSWSDRSVQVIGVGDSITAGLGAKSPSHTFFNRILNNPRDEYTDMAGVCLSSVLSNLTSENYAISGSESSTHREVIDETIPVFDEDVYLSLIHI